jgi:hypothetical protein
MEEGPFREGYSCLYSQETPGIHRGPKILLEHLQDPSRGIRR